MALDDAMKADLLEFFKGSGIMTKDEIAGMVNGLDKKQSKELQKLQEGMDSVSKFAEAFSGVKPKKLMKALKNSKKEKPEGQQQQQQTKTTTDGGETKVTDPYAFAKKKKFKKLEDTVAQLKKANDEKDIALDNEKRLGVIGGFLSGMSWAKPSAREIVFKHYNERVTRNKDGELVIKLNDGDVAKFDQAFVDNDVPTQFDFALKAPEAGGSGITRGSDRKSDQLSLDDPLDTPEQRAAYGAKLAKMVA